VELFLLRHGHANTEAPRDSLRELTQRGRSEISRAIEADKDSLQSLEKLIVSPYLRAQQSAQIVRQLLGDVPQIDSDLLVPNADPKGVIQYLHHLYHHSGVNSLLVVGHQPLLGIVLDKLSGAEPGRYRMSTASLALMDAGVMAIGCCELRWLHHVTIDSVC